jgi:hypothetical protein
MYQVTLSHAKNPDINNGYWDEPPAEGCIKVSVPTMQDAAKICRAYIERNNIGGGNWTGGKVYKGKKQVALVSYNGRIWAMDGREIE